MLSSAPAAVTTVGAAVTTVRAHVSAVAAAIPAAIAAAVTTAISAIVAAAVTAVVSANSAVNIGVSRRYVRISRAPVVRGIRARIRGVSIPRIRISSDTDSNPHAGLGGRGSYCQHECEQRYCWDSNLLDYVHHGLLASTQFDAMRLLRGSCRPIKYYSRALPDPPGAPSDRARCCGTRKVLPGRVPHASCARNYQIYLKWYYCVIHTVIASV
jgi:hypothetical protein